MSIAGFLALALVFVLLSAVTGMVLLVRFLTKEPAEDEVMRFDPFAPRQPSLWFLQFFYWWRDRPGQITYRRDRQGRFRKLDR